MAQVEALSKPVLTKQLRYLMTIGCGVVVANIYYCQPLLGELARFFNVSDKTAAWVNICSQIGYGIGLFLIVPIGDMVVRKKLLVWMHWFAAVALLATSMATSITWMAAASLVVGIASTACQVFIPFAAHLAKDEERGMVLGSILGGLLTGILLSRTLSGFVAEHWGWKAVYYTAAGMMVVMAILLSFKLPLEKPAFTGTYKELMQSLVHLFKTQPTIRQSSLIGAPLFGALSAFWATLAFFLEGPPYGYSLSLIGLFGVIGAVGAVVSPFVGRLLDRKDPFVAIRFGILLMVAGYAILFGASWNIAVVVVGIILIDVGLQASHISNQTRNYALLPEARSRLNTIYMTFYFLGGTLGSIFGSLAWNAGGWKGVCGTGIALILVSGLASIVAARRSGSPVAL